MLRNLFYSKGDFKNIAILGLIIPIIFFILAGFLKEKFSFVGIGIAYALTFIVLFFTTVYLAKSKKEKFLTNNFLIFILRNAISVIIASLIVSINLPFILNITSQLVSIISSIFLFSTVYFLSSKFIFKLKEIDEIKFMLISKLKSSIN